LPAHKVGYGGSHEIRLINKSYRKMKSRYLTILSLHWWNMSLEILGSGFAMSMHEHRKADAHILLCAGATY
jgi:hypothetical protein